MALAGTVMALAGAKSEKGIVLGTSAGQIRGVIMPHHDLARPILEQTVERLKSEKNIQVIAVVSPNHFRPNGAELTTTTNLRDFPVETNLVKQLSELSPDFLIDQPLLDQEHGLFVPMGYLRYVFPEAKFVPIAVTPHLSQENIAKITEWLAENIGDHGLVVTSVDFSHGNMISKAMNFNDETIKTISTWNYDKLLSYGDEHVDSAKAVEIVMKTMQKEGAINWEVWYNTHGALLTNQPMLNGTSYVVGVFRLK